MKLSYLQLEAHLSKQLAALYVLNGTELLLKQDATQLVRKAAKQAGYDERIRFTPEAGSWEQLYTVLNSPSLFAEKRLLEIDCNEATPPKTAAGILQEYANNPSPNNILLIDMGKVDEKTSKSGWYSALDKAGIIVTIWPVSREQLPQWIIQRGKRYKLNITQDAANLLADYVEGNLSAAQAAIEKLYLLRPSHPIDIDIINTIITNEGRFTIFDFVENLIAGNRSRTFHILDTLIEEGTEPVLILWGIARELRLLATLADELKQGHPYEAIWQKHRIFARRQPAIRRFITKMSAADCRHLLLHAADIDKVIKGAAPGNARESLQLFCLRLV